MESSVTDDPLLEDKLVRPSAVVIGHGQQGLGQRARQACCKFRQRLFIFFEIDGPGVIRVRSLEYRYAADPAGIFIHAKGDHLYLVEKQCPGLSGHGYGGQCRRCATCFRGKEGLPARVFIQGFLSRAWLCFWLRGTASK